MQATYLPAPISPSQAINPGEWTWATRNGQPNGVWGTNPDGDPALFLTSLGWTVTGDERSITTLAPGGNEYPEPWRLVNGEWVRT